MLISCFLLLFSLFPPKEERQDPVECESSKDVDALSLGRIQDHIFEAREIHAVQRGINLVRDGEDHEASTDSASWSRTRRASGYSETSPEDPEGSENNRGLASTVHRQCYRASES